MQNFIGQSFTQKTWQSKRRPKQEKERPVAKLAA